MWILVLLAGVTTALVGRDGARFWIQSVARRDLERGALSRAQQWLRWSAWCDPSDGTTDLMLASCYRQRQETDRWKAALEVASKKGLDAARLQREARLQLAREGVLGDAAISQLIASADTFPLSYDVPASLVYGYLAKRRYDLAERLLDAWNADFPDSPHVDYMRARYWEARGNREQAREFLRAALDAQPRHELAGTALAESYEKTEELEQALQQYIELAVASPAAETATIGIARILRRRGQGERAQALLDELAERAPLSSEVVVEMGRLALERGDYSAAAARFQQADLIKTENIDLLATALSLDGRFADARPYFEWATQARNRLVRTYDLRTRLSLDRGDSAAAAELQQLVTEPQPPPDLERSLSAAQSGRELYQAHCATCHGASGEGDGRAARHVFPAPRNLRYEPARLVSTDNGVPTQDDIVAVLRRGIPGTAMSSYRHLDDAQLVMLADEVRYLRQQGLRQELSELRAAEGEEVELEEVRQDVELRMTPGETVVVPSLGTPTTASLSRGKVLFQQQGCASCHGPDGIGAAGSTWYDRNQRPLRPRDLVHEPMKGGDSPAAVYLRIVVGMPGTPHPASRTLDRQQAIDLVHYCRSLSQVPKQVLSNFQRAQLATSEAYLRRVRPDK